MKEELHNLLIPVTVFVLIVAFALAPIPGGDDWEIISGAARRILFGGPLYGPKHCGELACGHFYNPPWLAALLLPLSLLPFRWGWAILSAASLVLSLCLLRRWQADAGVVKPVLVLLSPAMFYILLHGQVDALVLGGIFLPVECWGLVALTKSQVAIGLAFGARPRWLRAVIVTVLILLISLALFGDWPLQLMQQPAPGSERGLATHNLWLYLWPFQLPVGIALLLLGIARNDERLLVAASPLLSPYAAVSSLLGPWIAACTFLSDWQATVVFLSWWGAVAYRIVQ